MHDVSCTTEEADRQSLGADVVGFGVEDEIVEYVRKDPKPVEVQTC
jgi:hypothetical protein